MAKIVKFTPKDPRLSVEVMDRMAAVAADIYFNRHHMIRPKPEPLWRARFTAGGAPRRVMSAEVAARWLYDSLTIPSAKKSEFDKLVADAGIADNRTGQLALTALIERTAVTQPAVLEAVAARFHATIVADEKSEAALVFDLDARQREIEDQRVETLRDWLDGSGWGAIMVLVHERRDTPFTDLDDLSRWSQESWHGSEAFGRAPTDGLSRQAANDTIFHWLEGADTGILRLNRIVANKMDRR